MKLKKQPNDSQCSIHEAVQFLIEECIRNNEPKKAMALKGALAQMSTSELISDNGEYHEIIILLKRIINLEKESLDQLIEVIEYVEKYDKEEIVH